MVSIRLRQPHIAFSLGGHAESLGNGGQPRVTVYGGKLIFNQALFTDLESSFGRRNVIREIDWKIAWLHLSTGGHCEGVRTLIPASN
jgi:hypothetical protein